MKILVTGATGFLGSHLCKKLDGEGFEVVKLGSRDCDLTVDGSLSKALAGRKGDFDRIIHLAAWTQAGDFCLKHPGEQWLINQKINTNVLSYWKDEQEQSKLLFMGTSCSYDPALALREENYMAGVPIDSLFTYAMTKRMLYAGALALNRQYGMKYLCFVPSTLYGPGYHTDDRQMHFIFDLIRKIIRGNLFGEEVVLWGDGNQKRELVYIADFTSAMMALDGRCENELINIGEGQEHTIKEFAGMICDEVGYDFSKIQFDASRYVGAKSKCLDIGKLMKLYPEYRPTPLKAGLGATIKWFMQQAWKKG